MSLSGNFSLALIENKVNKINKYENAFDWLETELDDILGKAESNSLWMNESSLTINRIENEGFLRCVLEVKELIEHIKESSGIK